MACASVHCPVYFYPRSPRGERQRTRKCSPTPQNFYPRSPRGERHMLVYGLKLPDLFLSTLPARGATLGRPPPLAGNIISIHAPREGSDRKADCYSHGRNHFYPRSPRGERRHAGPSAGLRRHISIHAPREGSDLMNAGRSRSTCEFLSTLPARGATIRGSQRCNVYPGFLSTLPARGATPDQIRDVVAETRFLSTLPARGATANVLKNKRLSSAAFV